MLFSAVKKNLLLATALLLFVTTLSCGDDDGTPTVVEPTIYIAGTELLADESTQIVYYEGTQMSVIAGAPGERLFSTGITSDGTDVYVSGNIFNSSISGGAYWVNGMLNRLEVGTGFQSRCRGHEFWDGDIYAYGDIQLQGGGNQAVYWKNGEIVVLENSFRSSRANGIALVNGKIIVAGVGFAAGVGSVPLIWVDGEVQQLSPGNTRGVIPIEIEEHQGDHYIIGLASTRANFSPVICTWKNGVLTEDPEDLNIQNIPDMEVSGYDPSVYYLVTAVTATGRRMMYRKDDTDVILVDDTTEAIFLTDIEVKDDKVYVLGNIQTSTSPIVIQPILWIDGVEQTDFPWPDFLQGFDMYVR